MEGVSLHPDVTSEDFSEDIFALNLGPLADGNPVDHLAARKDQRREPVEGNEILNVI